MERTDEEGQVLLPEWQVETESVQGLFPLGLWRLRADEHVDGITDCKHANENDQ